MATSRKAPRPAMPVQEQPPDCEVEPVANGAPGPAAQEFQAHDAGDYDRALRELEISVPVAACRRVGDRLEFRLYGGRVVYWPASAEQEAAC